LGIGAGAHAKITDGSQQSITRYWKHKHPKDYLGRKESRYISGSRTLDGKELVFEFLMNALRLSEGFQVDTYLKRTGLGLSNLRGTLALPIENGLIEWDEIESHVKTSELGKRFLNNILQDCLP